MNAGWVAGTVRSRLLARHRLGRDGARAVADAGSIEAAAARLRASNYGPVAADGADVSRMQHDIWASVLWDLRVLAGWLPPDGVDALRVLAALWELRNIEGLLFPPAIEPGFELGMLGTAWSLLRAVTQPADVRDVLRRSAWGDPGSDEPAELLTRLRIDWARRVGGVDESWGAGAAVLVIARLIVLGGRADAGIVRRVPALSAHIADATTLAELQSLAPAAARWLFGDAEEPVDLWKAEARWWRRVDRDAARWLRSASAGKPVVVGAAASLMVDAWQTSAALEIAARGGRGREVLDVAA